MEVDEATKGWERIDYARLKVRTAISLKVDMVSDIMSNDNLCQVSVMEECGAEENEHSNAWQSSHFRSSSSSAIGRHLVRLS